MPKRWELKAPKVIGAKEGFELTVDLEAGVIRGSSAGDIEFNIDSFRRIIRIRIE